MKQSLPPGIYGNCSICNTFVDDSLIGAECKTCHPNDALDYEKVVVGPHCDRDGARFCKADDHHYGLDAHVTREDL